MQQTTSELGCFRRHRAQVVTVNTKHLLIAAAGSGWPACARVRSLSMNNFVGNESRKWTAPGNPKYALNKKTPDIKVPADGLNSDIHASAEYRAHLVNVMARRAVDAANK